jgi:hypothetical protein
MITVEGLGNATNFLSELVGKPIEVLLLNRQEGHQCWAGRPHDQ